MLYTSGAMYYPAVVYIDMLCVVSAGCVIQIWVLPRGCLAIPALFPGSLLWGVGESLEIGLISCMVL